MLTNNYIIHKIILKYYQYLWFMNHIFQSRDKIVLTLSSSTCQ